MKLLIWFLFLMSVNCMACNFTSLLDNIPPELSVIAPPSECLKDPMLLIMDEPEKRETHCKCANDFREKYDYQLNSHKNIDIQRKMVTSLWEKNKRALFNLTNDLSALQHPSYPENQRAGKDCNKMLSQDLINLQCPGKNTILSANIIKKLSGSVHQMAVAELKYKKGLPEGKSMYPREGIQCEASLTEYDLYEFVTDFTPVLVENLNLIVKGADTETLQSAQNIFELIDNTLRSSPKNHRNLREYVRNANRHPLLENILTDPEIFKQLKSGKINDFGKISELLNKSKVEEITNNCAAIRDNIIETLCMQRTDNIFPSDLGEFDNLVTEMKGSDRIENSLISNDLSSAFCQQQNSKYKKIAEELYATLPSMHDKSKYRPEAEIKSFTEPNAELICEYLTPPSENYATFKQALNQCKNGTNPKELHPVSYECAVVSMIDIRTKSPLEKLRLAKKEELLRDSPNLATDELEARLDTFISQVPYREINPKEKELTKIAHYFEHGANAPERESQPDRRIADSRSSSSTGSGLADGNLSKGQKAGQSQTVRSTEVNQQQINRNMNDFYDEVRRKLEAGRKAHIASGKPSSGIPDYLKPAFELPESFREPSSSGDNNLGTTVASAGVTSFSNGDTTRLQPGGGETNPQERTSRDKTVAEEINQALLEANQERARQAAIANGTGPAPVTFANLGEKSFTGEIPELTISGNLDEDLEQLIKHNFPEVELLLELLSENAKSFFIVHKDYPDYRVQIMRKASGFQVIATENHADSNYMKFVDSIKRSLNVQDQFQKLISKLRVLVEGEAPNREPSNDFQELNRAFQ